MRVTALGVGDAFSCLYYSTCLLVEHGGARLLIDCPHPIRKILRENGGGVDLPDIDAVVLTHLHADHCSGLEGFGFFSHFVLHRRATILACPEVAARLWPHHLAAGMDRLWRPERGALEELGFEDYFEHLPLTLEAPARFGPFSIEIRMTRHHVPTTALRLRAGGRTLGYSADTGFDPGLIDWLADADLIIHETNLGAHTPHEALEGLPEPVRGKLRLVHYPDFFDAARSALPCLREGVALTV
jgi:ribonuclease BN (tRNA processing enzyme)